MEMGVRGYRVTTLRVTPKQWSWVHAEARRRIERDCAGRPDASRVVRGLIDEAMSRSGGGESSVPLRPDVPSTRTRRRAFHVGAAAVARPHTQTRRG